MTEAWASRYISVTVTVTVTLTVTLTLIVTVTILLPASGFLYHPVLLP